MSYASGLKTILVPRQGCDHNYILELDQATNSNEHLIISKVNEDLYDLSIIKNSRLLEGYKSTIRYLIEKKKEDIREIHQYVVHRNDEIAEYKKQIEELSSKETIDEEPDQDPGNLDCSIEQLLRKQLDCTKTEYTLEVISATRPFTLMLSINDIQILIEITSISKNANDSLINSFKARVASSSANYGIFISMENTYTIKSGISDFSIINENDKYLLFIANLESNHSKFKNAVNILSIIASK